MSVWGYLEVGAFFRTDSDTQQSTQLGISLLKYGYAIGNTPNQVSSFLPTLNAYRYLGYIVRVAALRTHTTARVGAFVNVASIPISGIIFIIVVSH
jgi:hypothetical protein